MALMWLGAFFPDLPTLTASDGALSHDPAELSFRGSHARILEKLNGDLAGDCDVFPVRRFRALRSSVRDANIAGQV